MAEYIERSEAIEFIKHNTPNINGETTVKCFVRSLENVPAADVAEVVRCKECKYRDEMPNKNIWCDKHVVFMRMKPDDFCSYGERKESE